MISVFKSYENRPDSDFAQLIESFEEFLHDLQRPYGAIDFKDLGYYSEEWVQDDMIDYVTYPRDGYRRVLYDFDVTFGLYANAASERDVKDIEMLEAVANEDNSVNLVTFFCSDESIKPEVVTIKERLAKRWPNRFADVHSLGELKLQFLLQLSGFSFFNGARPSVGRGAIYFGDTLVDDLCNIPYLKGFEEQGAEILDALWFAMELQHRPYHDEFYLQLPALIKEHKFEQIVEMLNYDDIHSQLKARIKTYKKSQGRYGYRERDDVFIALDKLKMLALTELILDCDSDKSRAQQRKYYKERCRATQACKLPLHIKMKALMEYTALLKSEKLEVALWEECLAGYFKILDEGRPQSEGHLDSRGQWCTEWDFTYMCSSNDTYKEAFASRMLQDAIIAYYEHKRNFKKVEELCLFEIGRHRMCGDSMEYSSRLVQLYAKLGAVYEAKCTGGRCVL